MKKKSEELQSILLNAVQTSPLVEKAIAQQTDYIDAWFHDQSTLLNQNLYLVGGDTYDASLLQLLHQKTLAHINKDIQDFAILNQHLSNYTASEHFGALNWSLKTNKMVEVLAGAKDILADQNNFNAILYGAYPSNMMPDTTFPIWLGKGVLGTSTATFLTAAILEVQLSLNEAVEKIGNIAVPHDDETQHWLDESSLAHIVPLPESLISNLPIGFLDHFTYHFSDPNTPNGIVYLHSGYAFGGHRFETRYPEGKLYGPEDCSSWTAKLLDIDLPISTHHMYAYYLDAKLNQTTFQDADPFVAALEDKLLPCIDLPESILPGTIVTNRIVDPLLPATHLGTSGHTALVIGELDGGDLLVLNYGRSMPQREGFGFERFNPTETSTKKVIFFEDIFSDDNVMYADTPSGVLDSLYYPARFEIPEINEIINA